MKSKLFRASDRFQDDYYCFAPNADIANKIILKKYFKNKKIKLNITDVTEEKINDDGVQFLLNKNFVGVPQQSVFMLNGCMQSMIEHYENKRLSEVFWWSDDVPGSKECRG